MKKDNRQLFKYLTSHTSPKVKGREALQEILYSPEDKAFWATNGQSIAKIPVSMLPTVRGIPEDRCFVRLAKDGLTIERVENGFSPPLHKTVNLVSHMATEEIKLPGIQEPLVLRAVIEAGINVDPYKFCTLNPKEKSCVYAKHSHAGDFPYGTKLLVNKDRTCFTLTDSVWLMTCMGVRG